MHDAEKVLLFDKDYKLVGAVELPKKMPAGGPRGVRFKGKLYTEGVPGELVETPDEVREAQYAK
jgi:hypothetical protein